MTIDELLQIEPTERLARAIGCKPRELCALCLRPMAADNAQEYNNKPAHPHCVERAGQGE